MAYVPRPKIAHECAECGTDFLGTAAARYCSPACRYRARDARRTIPCAVCSEPMVIGATTAAEGIAAHNECRKSAHGHGTVRRYSIGCRCDDCRTAKVDQLRLYREQRRQSRNPVRSTGSNSRWIADSIRLSIYDRDGWTCAICYEPVDREVDSNADMAPSLDHIIPRSRGGSHYADNLRTAHRRCNSLRQDRVA